MVLYREEIIRGVRNDICYAKSSEIASSSREGSEERHEMVLRLLEPDGCTTDQQKQEIIAIRPLPAFSSVLCMRDNIESKDDDAGFACAKKMSVNTPPSFSDDCNGTHRQLSPKQLTETYHEATLPASPDDTCHQYRCSTQVA